METVALRCGKYNADHSENTTFDELIVGHYRLSEIEITLNVTG